MPPPVPTNTQINLSFNLLSALRRYFHCMIRMIFLFLFVPATAFSQTTHVNVYFLDKPNKKGSDTIYYKPDYRLKWSDFQGQPEPGHTAGAITASGFAYEADMERSNDKTVINFYVYTYFNRRHSWKKPNINSAYHLEHEQRHFDITYIGAIRFYRELKKARINASNFSTLSGEIFNRLYDENTALQRQYDRETRHSINTEAQAAWNNKIDEMLKTVAGDR